MHPSRIGRELLQHYRILAATTPQLLKEVYGIRYTVYCHQLGYEDPSKFPDDLEYDQHDPHAIHCLLQERRTGLFVGCVRMIRADANNPRHKLPFEDICEDGACDRTALDILPCMDRDTLAEVSRLALVYPEKPNDPLLEETGREFLRHRGLGLYLAVVGVVSGWGLENVFAIMEPRLQCLLARYGIMFQQVGDVIDHHGRRAPFHATKSSLTENLSPEMCELLGLIMQDLRHEAHRWDTRCPSLLRAS